MPFGFLGNAQRFAGDALSKAYNGVDNQLGGVLPGGVKPSGTGLGMEILKDALPGDRKPSFTEKASKKINAGGRDFSEGNLLGASASLHGNKAGADLREKTVEKVRDKTVQMVGEKALSGPLRTGAGILAPPLLIADRINDVKDAYSLGLEIRTGQDLDAHMGDASIKRDPLYGVPTEPTYVGPSDGSIPAIEQRDKSNPFLQEFKNRAALVGENFNPLEGEWGITEALYGK